MAGTLLLHVGIDLFLEGVWDSYGKFDLLEYSGIWLIVIVMSFYGMESAMVAGGIAAVSTYAVQNVAYLNPIRGVMPATTLRSSDWNRNASSEAILADSDIGRSRILVVQLQGHLFFSEIWLSLRIKCTSYYLHKNKPVVLRTEILAKRRQCP